MSDAAPTPSRFDRARAIFDEIAGLEASERAARLAERCAGDDELRAFVELLFDADERAEAPIDAPALGPGFSVRFAEETRLPEAIGPYRVVRLIGYGGMGTVYEALQEHPDRPVAVKVLRTALAGPSAARRFGFEVKLLARLRHPNIAQIHDAGVHDGAPYLVIELVRGSRSVTEHAESRDISVRERVTLALALCAAIQHAHQNGVIHRDLKPDNVLVDDEGNLKVIDFGVARAVRGSDDEASIASRSHRTQTGQIVGTVAYMSPEQLAGDSATIDARADIYAIGAILYELLGRRLPLDLRSRSAAEAARIVAETRPRPLRELDAAIDADLSTIVAKALEKEPEHRYQSVGELAEDLRRHLADEPIRARPETRWRQARRFARRNRALVAGAGVALAALVTATIVASWASVRDARLRDEAERLAYRSALSAAESALRSHDVATARTALDGAPQRLRGWEWRHLASRVDDSLLVVPTGGRQASHLGIRHDGAIVTRIVDDDRTLVEWTSRDDRLEPASRRAGVREWTIDRHHTAEAFVDFDGRIKVRTEPESSFVALDRATLGIAADADVHSIAFTDRSDRVVFVEMEDESGYGLVRVVGIDGSDPRARRFRICRTSFRMATFGPLVALPSMCDVHACVWDSDLDSVVVLDSAEGMADEIAFAPDGSVVYTGNLDATVRAWDPRSGIELATGRGHGDFVRAVAVRDDGLIATGGVDRTICLWDPHTLTLRRRLRGHADGISALGFSPCGERLVSSSVDATIRVWSTERIDDPHLIVTHEGFVYDIAISGDGRRIASAGWDGFVGRPGGLRVHDAESATPLLQLGTDDERFFGVAISDDGRLVAAANQHELIVVEVDSGTVILRRPETPRNVANHQTAPLRFARDGNRDVLWCGLLRIDLRNGSESWLELRSDGEPHDTDPIWVRFSDDGCLVAIGGHEQVRVHTVDDGALRHDFPVEHRGLAGIAFDATNTRLAFVSQSGGGHLWDLRSGATLARLGTENERFLCVAFSPDGRCLAIGGHDRAVRLWCLERHEELVRLRGPRGNVKAIVWSRDGQTIYTGSGDGTVRRWDGGGAPGGSNRP